MQETVSCTSFVSDMPHDSDANRDDDLVNPLTPWRSVAIVFVGGWGAVLLEPLDLPGRYGSFQPWHLLLPFLMAAGYWVFWMGWRSAQRRHQRRSRERRAMLGHDRQH
ncbi:hypothetical protein [Caulobacter segnis]